MPKKRDRDNKGLPERWRYRAGAYRYRVPPGLEHKWDNKTEFTLGKTLSEAYRVWADRVETAGDCTTISELLDRYKIEIIPQKKASTARDQPAMVEKLRPVFGAMNIADLEPHHVYAYFDKRSAKTAAKREIEILRHALTQAVRWGIIKENPLIGQLQLSVPKKKTAYISDEQIMAALKVETRPKSPGRMIQAYIRLKLLTGLRRTDMLNLEASNITDAGLLVDTSKTGRGVLITWTDALRLAVDDVKAARPYDIAPWLFCNRNGEKYINEAAEANGFESAWQRFMQKLPKAHRFPERALRNKAATDAESEEHAQRLLAHADASTTRRFYRLKPDVVAPLK